MLSSIEKRPRRINLAAIGPYYFKNLQQVTGQLILMCNGQAVRRLCIPSGLSSKFHSLPVVRWR